MGHSRHDVAKWLSHQRRLQALEEGLNALYNKKLKYRLNNVKRNSWTIENVIREQRKRFAQEKDPAQEKDHAVAVPPAQEKDAQK